MLLFRNLFSTSQNSKGSAPGHRARGSHSSGMGSAHGPETKPVRMNLEERMSFRRELLYETIRASLDGRSIAASSYRFKVMHTDKRGHCYVVMLDMSPKFMASPVGDHASLKAIAADVIGNANKKYGLQVGGVYWRSDETLDASVAAWARPSVSAPLVHATEGQRQDNIENFEAVTAQEMAEFEAAWQNESAIQIGKRSYLSDLAPLADTPQNK